MRGGRAEPPTYSEYTCYTGIADFTPPDIDIGEERGQAGARGWDPGTQGERALSRGSGRSTPPGAGQGGAAPERVCIWVLQQKVPHPHHILPPDPPNPAVGYRVFLGNGQYFVSSDVGGGKMQWYAFHKEPRDGVGEWREWEGWGRRVENCFAFLLNVTPPTPADPPGGRKQRLMEIFGHWSPMGE